MPTLKIPENNTPQYYRLSTAGRTVMANKGAQFVHDRVIELNLLKQTGKTLEIRYKLHHQTMEGSALIHQWAADMEKLQSPLIFITGLEGNLEDIGNFEFLFHKWTTGFAQQIAPAYKDRREGLAVMMDETTKLLGDRERFLKSFSGYSAWRFFFQNWFRIHEEQEGSEFQVDGYFGKTDLPLNIESSWKKNNSPRPEWTLENTGSLNKKKFDRKAFAGTLKDLTNIYNIDATLDVVMEEKYLFGANGWLKEAEMFLSTTVADWYAVTSAHQLKKLSEQEFHELNNEYKKNEERQQQPAVGNKR